MVTTFPRSLERPQLLDDFRPVLDVRLWVGRRAAARLRWPDEHPHQGWDVRLMAGAPLTAGDGGENRFRQSGGVRGLEGWCAI
jgi:hypothetical protein